jgi:hypothetical protein
MSAVTGRASRLGHERRLGTRADLARRWVEVRAAIISGFKRRQGQGAPDPAGGLGAAAPQSDHALPAVTLAAVQKKAGLSPGFS